jgi:hypothetical protein
MADIEIPKALPSQEPHPIDVWEAKHEDDDPTKEIVLTGRKITTLTDNPIFPQLGHSEESLVDKTAIALVSQVFEPIWAIVKEMEEKETRKATDKVSREITKVNEGFGLTGFGLIRGGKK